MRYAQWNEFLYWVRASRVCIRVLITLDVSSVRQEASCKPYKILLQGHGRIDCHETSNGTYSECDGTRQWLAGPGCSLHELLKSQVGRKSNRGIGSLSHHLPRRSESFPIRNEWGAHNRKQTTIDTKDTLLSNDRRGSVNETTILGIGTLSIINKFRPESLRVNKAVNDIEWRDSLDGFWRSDRKDGLHHTSSQTSCSRGIKFSLKQIRTIGT
jgi:hypothetical protein